MTFSYNWLKKYIKGRVPKAEKLAEFLTTHSFEVSEVRKSGSDYALDVDILPNRGPDCFSHIGLARECSVILNSKFKLPDSKIKESKQHKAKDLLTIEIKNKKACPRYTARVVVGVKVGPSPKWLKEKLKVCGIQSINNVVDIANFVMLETGQPLHAFDGDKLEDRKIIVRFGKRREKIVTLDEEKYDLDSDILVIADTKKPITIAGIKGGIIPAIDKKTKIVVLESANFDSKVIRKGSQKINLSTDASWRFEHGIDPNLTEFAVNRAAFLLQEIASGTVAQGLIDFYPKKVLPKKVKLDLSYLEKLLGTKMPKEKGKRILNRLGFKVIRFKYPNLLVEAPTFRLDINIPEDLIEEIGRIIGYDKIKPVLPVSSLVPSRTNLEIFWENFTKDILKEIGFCEVYNYSFINQKEAEIFSYSNRDLIEIENPISENQKYLRPSLIPHLIKNVENNHRDFQEINIFELGKIFRKESSQKYLEKRSLTGLLFRESEKEESFYELKGVCDLLLEKAGISDFWYNTHKATPEESKKSIWHIKKCAEIKVAQQEIGFLGEISPRILEYFDFH